MTGSFPAAGRGGAAAAAAGVPDGGGSPGRGGWTEAGR